ncbi:MAG: thioredoxin family protein [Acidobacteria bacterium]|nr:thioredoxin family protein [Acidobacteriota bacterium]
MTGSRRADRLSALAGAAALVLLAVVAPASAQAFSTAKVLTARAAVSVDRVHPGTSFQIAAVVTIAPGWHINAHNPTLDYLIPSLLAIAPAEGFTYHEPVYPAHVEKAFAFTEGKTLRVYEGEIVVGLDVAAAASIAPGPVTLRATFSAQACNDESCLAPGKVSLDVPVVIASPGDAVALVDREIFSRVAFVAAGGASAPAGDGGGGDVAAMVARHGLLLAFPLIFLGGLALNLTPCVYPLIPITISYFGGQAAGRAPRRLLLASLYVLGMAVTYSTLGAVAAATGGLLGSALQSPWVLGFVAAVLVALALSMFGFFEIALPGFIVNRISSRQGAFGALFMGLTVGLVAAPCIGPFVFGLLAYVGQQGSPALGFVMFFVLALGLGVPFLVLAMFSGALSTMPRAGAWMIWVRSLFGCVLVGMAIYFLRPVLPETAARVGLGALVIGSGIFLGFLERSAVKTAAFRGVRYATAALAVAVGAWTLMPGGPAKAGIEFRPLDAAGLAQAAAAGRPVLIDFSAEWCIACKELERYTFTDPHVRDEAARFVAMRADLTSYADPAVEEIKKRFGILGLPWVVLLDRSGEERKDLRVTGFVEPADFLARLRQVPGG